MRIYQVSIPEFDTHWRILNERHDPSLTSNKMLVFHHKESLINSSFQDECWETLHFRELIISVLKYAGGTMVNVALTLAKSGYE